jgi:hypothetical protein
MKRKKKRFEALIPGDFDECPVWQYLNDDALGETVVAPVLKLPVDNLDGKVVGTQVRLANGASTWAILSNVDAGNPRFTQHFITVSVWWSNTWFTMARYHDHDSAGRGPDALADFLGLKLKDTFPIYYDLTGVAIGHEDALRATITAVPKERLTRSEIIRLAMR